MVVVMMVVMVMFIMLCGSAEMLQSMPERGAHLVHLRDCPLQQGSDICVALIGHNLSPLVEFCDVTTVMINPVLQKYP